MFKCQITGKVTRPGEKMTRIAVETRPKVYTEWVREDGEWVELEVGRGFETVKEILVSEEGVRLYNQKENS